MKLYGTYEGRPVIAIAYFQSKSVPMAVVIGDEDSPRAIPLSEFKLPRLPRRLRKKIIAYARRETKAAQAELGGPH